MKTQHIAIGDTVKFSASNGTSDILIEKIDHSDLYPYKGICVLGPCKGMRYNLKFDEITVQYKADRIKDSIDMEIQNERIRQDSKWGVQNHEPFKYLSILGEEVGECHKAALDSFTWPHGPFGSIEELRAELIQVAAVTKAFIECLDRDEWRGQ